MKDDDDIAPLQYMISIQMIEYKCTKEERGGLWVHPVDAKTVIMKLQLVILLSHNMDYVIVWYDDNLRIGNQGRLYSTCGSKAPVSDGHLNSMHFELKVGNN